MVGRKKISEKIKQSREVLRSSGRKAVDWGVLRFLFGSKQMENVGLFFVRNRKVVEPLIFEWI